MATAAFRAAEAQNNALNACPLLQRPDLPDEGRLEPLRLAAIYKAIAPTYVALNAYVQRGGAPRPVAMAIAHRTSQLRVFAHARVAPCRVLRQWAATGWTTDAPLFRALGVSPDAYPASWNGRGDLVIAAAVADLRSTGYSRVELDQMRLALDPALYAP